MVTSVVIIDHLKCYLTGEFNGLLSQFSFFEGKKHQVQAHGDSIRQLVLNDEKSQVFTASSDMFIKVFQVVGLELLRAVKVHSDLVNCLAFDGKLKVLISSSWDGSIKVLNENHLEEKARVLNHLACVTGLVLWNDSKFCISVDVKGFTKLWNLQKRKLISDVIYRKGFDVEKVLNLKRFFLVFDKKILIVFKNSLLGV
jgi:WD40 repeat protein